MRQPAAGSASKLERLTNKISDALFEDQLAAAMSGKLGAHGAVALNVWLPTMGKGGHAQQASWGLAGWSRSFRFDAVASKLQLLGEEPARQPLLHGDHVT